MSNQYELLLDLSCFVLRMESTLFGPRFLMRNQTSLSLVGFSFNYYEGILSSTSYPYKGRQTHNSNFHQDPNDVIQQFLSEQIK